jgi:hypothetical protein
MKLFVPAGLCFFLFVNYDVPVKAQSMRNLFLMLPQECTPMLNESGRKILIKEDEFTVAAQKEKDEIDYAIDTATDNYLSYEYSANDGKGTNIIYQIKKIKINTDNYILFFTKDADTRNKSDKFVFKSYTISGNSLKENQQLYIPDNLNFSFFVKPDTPDSIETSIAKTASCAYDLDIGSTDKVNFHVTLKSDKDKKWLTGDMMVFQWNGTMFTNSIIFQKEENIPAESIDRESYKR